MIKSSSSTYWFIQMKNRSYQFKLLSELVISLNFFSLFIISFMLEQIFKFMNMKTQKTKRTVKQRWWIFTSSVEIDVFVRILLFMNLQFINRRESYWDTHSDMHENFEISQTMTLTQFDQIKQFLKLFNSNSNSESQNSDYEKLWTAKLKSFSTLFQQICKQYLHSDWNMSVDEQLILFKNRFKHIMNILSKKVDREFKIYCLCSENYLYAFMYASKITQIVDLHQI